MKVMNPLRSIRFVESKLVMRFSNHREASCLKVPKCEIFMTIRAIENLTLGHPKVEIVEDLTQRFSHFQLSRTNLCPAGDSNPCPPNPELCTLTKVERQ
jgi:hypothetical protein